MSIKLSVFRLAIAASAVAAVLGNGTADAGSRPRLVSCGAETHAVVRHPIVNGHRIRRVTCVRNTAVQLRVVGTRGRTVASCGAGTHAVVHHPIVNGHRVRQVVCVR